MTGQPHPGSRLPELELPLVGGGTAKLGAPRPGRFQLVVVYRGRHCSFCKRYLAELEAVAGDLEAAGADVVALSADPAERAETDVSEHGWTFAVAYGLTPAQMRALGLYVSAPRSPRETDRPFAEPAALLVNPAGLLQVVCLSNAPWVRPDPRDLLYAVRRIQEVDYPIRGTL